MTENGALNQIEIFASVSGEVSVEVKLDSDNVWLSLNQLASLFARDKSVISRHLNNILREGELIENETVAKYATVQLEGNKSVKRQIDYYNLDMIISLGYRVNSKRGVEFRKWANSVLKNHLIKGYSINQKRLEQKSITELKQTVDLLSTTLINRKLVTREGEEILSLIKDYSRTWNILIKYDEDRLDIPEGTKTDKCITYEEAKDAIESIKKDLMTKKEASALFGNEKSNELDGIIGNVYQTFDGIELYLNLEEKAANLIYFIIKDHPFSDGNKRIGCLLFLFLLQKNRELIANIPTPEGLTAIALLIAESRPDQKELIVKLVMNLIAPAQD